MTRRSKYKAFQKQRGAELTRADRKMGKNWDSFAAFIIEAGRTKLLFQRGATSPQRQVLKRRANKKRRQRDRKVIDTDS